MKSSQQIEAEGGPAFSYATGDPEAGGDIWPGMTLRDWFAGQALAGIMANPSVGNVPDDQVYLAAYRHADGMLIRRAQ